MKAKILVIGDMPLVTGMRLAGIEDCWAADENGFQQKLEDALQRTEFGILVVNEYMLNVIDWRLRKKLDTIAYPVIIPIPDYSGKTTEGEEIRNMIKRALGFDMGKKS